MNQSTLKKAWVVVTLVIMLTMNGLAVLLPLNNKTTQELSDAIPIFFVPAGYVFSIWSLIYVALIGYVVYQALPVSEGNSRVHSIWAVFSVNALANAGWIVLWHYEFVVLSVAMMFVILLTLLMIYVKLDIGTPAIRSRLTTTEYWCTHFPFSLYLGWISVATIANVAAALYVMDWNGFGISPELWSAIMIAIATVLALLMILRRRDMVFAGVVVWSLVGIGIKFTDVTVITASTVAGVVVLVIMAAMVALSKKPTA